MMRGVFAFVFVCVAVLVTVGESEGAENLAAKCNLLVQKVIPCMNYATGQAAVPTKGCCEATSEIKTSNPECLCFAIQQTHKGSPEVKSMGIQEARLLQLPTACNLKNASTTNCPKLLGLSPNSPDAAIFRNASSRSNSSSTVGTTTTTATTTAVSENQKASKGNMLRPALMSDLIAVVMLSIASAVNIYSSY
ncbi:non-specific lipid transfer protein GPI-anchored 1 [Cajanus cajan]|uniref:GPI-anchored protein At1g27950 family n=1 Tax=Cajanus cajan TaxID=3821 RepID=A0A151SDM9_CAJCA|nr:non-specific lipid transfer protein GPI-anchored 1 [Cajanus cajan]KYP52934.1 putative GPI-anchored protein At1g27950 family [Cajanus cajan]